MNRNKLFNKVLPMLALALTLVLAAGGAGASAPRTDAQAQQSRPIMGFVLNEDGSTLSLYDPAQQRVTGILRIVNAADFPADVVKGAISKPHLAAYDEATRMLYVGN